MAGKGARRIVLPGLLVVALLALLFTAVFPTRTFLTQRSAIAEKRTEVERLTAEQAELEARLAALSTPAEIERLARRDYGMIKPGEEAYLVLPPAPAPVALPDMWPYTSLPR